MCIRDSSGQKKRHLSLEDASFHQDDEYGKSNTEFVTNETAYGKNDNDTESNDVKRPNLAVQRTQTGHYGLFQWLRRLCSSDKHKHSHRSPSRTGTDKHSHRSPSITGTGLSSSLTGTDDVSWYVDANARAQMRREHARMFAETYRQIYAERCGSKTSSGSELSFGRVSVSVQNISIEECEEGLKTTSPDTAQFHGVLFTESTEKDPVIRTASGGQFRRKKFFKFFSGQLSASWKL